MMDSKAKIGLVLEGGAYRGMFTCGVLDVMMENHVQVNGVVGVSAGAAFGVNYCSGQIGRALRYNQRFAGDRRYGGLYSLITSGDLYNAHFCYHVVPIEYDVFDYEKFLASEVDFHLVCTDVVTGEPVYHLLRDPDIHVALEWIRASASMPMVSNVVEVGGYRLLDGGMTDSIPLEYFQRQGYERNIVVLTQPLGYEKRLTKAMPLIRLLLRKYPKMVDAMARRHHMYNAQLEYVAAQEKAGNALVIRPAEPLTIGHTCTDPALMAHTHQLGRQQALAHLKEIQEFAK
ncbi:MAG: patatin family protein [Bacteroidales bacterium]|nr:patatin family protein [Bacteroidales bacterium]